MSLNLNSGELDPTPDSLRDIAPAPADPPAEEPKATPEGEKQNEEYKKAEDEPQKKQGGFQRRIHKLIDERNERDARIAALEEENSRLKGPKPTEKPNEEPKQPEAKGRPTPPDESKFSSYDEFKQAERQYLEDLADWKAEERINARERERQESEAKEKSEKEAREIRNAWADKVDAAHAAHPDLDRLLGENDLPVTPAMNTVLLRSEQGGELLYYLASNPIECQRLAGLSAEDATFEMGRLAASLSTKTPETPKKSATSAPAPLQPLKGSATAVTDPSKLSDAEWLRQERAARRR